MSSKHPLIDRMGAKAGMARIYQQKQAEATADKLIDHLHHVIEPRANEAAAKGRTEVKVNVSLSQFGMPDAFYDPEMDHIHKKRLLHIVEDKILKEFVAKWTAEGRDGISFYSEYDPDDMTVHLDLSSATAEFMEASNAGAAASGSSSGVKPEAKSDMGSIDADGTIVLE